MTTITDPDQIKTHIHEAFERIWNEGDLSFIDEHYADDYVAHDPSYPGEIRGPEGFKEYVRTFRTAFPDIEANPIDIIVEGETVALRYAWRGTHEGELMGIEPTGKTVEATGMAFLRFEDGKRKEDWFLGDTLGLLQQLGVVKPPVA